MATKSIAGFMVALSTLFPTACSRTVQEIRINNVVRVFWHEGTRYSVQTQEPGSTEIKTINLPRCACSELVQPDTDRFKTFADVPHKESMWVYEKIKLSDGWSGECALEVVIHVHTKDDIEGGGWNHGKFGSGSTHVIE